MIDGLARKDLQAACKARGIKANGKSADLRDSLEAYVTELGGGDTAAPSPGRCQRRVHTMTSTTHTVHLEAWAHR